MPRKDLMRVDLTGCCTHESLQAMHQGLVSCAPHVPPEQAQPLQAATDLLARLVVLTAPNSTDVLIRFKSFSRVERITIIRLFRDTLYLGLCDAKTMVDNYVSRMEAGHAFVCPGLTRENAETLRENARRALGVLWWRKGPVEDDDWEPVPLHVLRTLRALRDDHWVNSPACIGPVHLRESHANEAAEELRQRPVAVEIRPVLEIEVL